jgi:hypothetical protein
MTLILKNAKPTLEEVNKVLLKDALKKLAIPQAKFPSLDI